MTEFLAALKARKIVQWQYNETGIGTPRGTEIEPLILEEVQIVYFTYTLGNWKAIVTTSRADGRLYEVTHNVLKGETYLDTYLKTHNIVAESNPQYATGPDLTRLHIDKD